MNTQKSLPQSTMPLYYKSLDWESFFKETPAPGVWHDHSRKGRQAAAAA